MEICDGKGRSASYTSGFLSWTVGMVILPFIGWYNQIDLDMNQSNNITTQQKPWETGMHLPW